MIEGTKMTGNYIYNGRRYFLSVFIGTGFFWGLGSVMSFSSFWKEYYMLPMLLGLMTPAIVAWTMIWRQSQGALRRDFLMRLYSINLIRPGVFLFSLMLMPLSVLFSILISFGIGGSSEQLQISETFSFTTGVVPVFLLLFLAALFEELGWRGYGFESLQDGRSYFMASLLFGILWSLWHLPLLWVYDSYQYVIYQQSPWYALNFYISTVVLGVIISWVCVINRRSILVAILFHFVVNLSQEMLSMTQQTKIIQTFVLIVFAMIIIRNQWALFKHHTPLQSTNTKGTGSVGQSLS
jgi:membrane protease YdiL (CAAX protease family)